MKIFIYSFSFILILLFVACGHEKHKLITVDELYGRYDLKMDSTSYSGEGAKNAAMHALLRYEYHFYENATYAFNHNLGGMTKQVMGNWKLSNDSIYMTDDRNPNTFNFNFFIESRVENGYRIRKQDGSLIHLIRNKAF